MNRSDKHSQSSFTLGATSSLALGALFISLAAPIVKATQVDPNIAAVFRMFFGALALLLLMLGQSRWRSGWQHGWSSSALIAFFFALDLWFWHRSIHWIGPGLATLLANFQVFLLPIAGFVLQSERPGPRFIGGLTLAALGLSLLFGLSWSEFSSINRWGVIYGLLTAMAYSAYILSLRYFQSKPNAPAAAARLFQVCVWCAALLALSTWDIRQEYLTISTQDWLLLAALGVVCQVFGWLLITRGLPGVAAAIAGLLLLLQPALSLGWDFLFFGLSLGMWQLLGVVLALLGIYIGSVRLAGK
ncbi:MAG: DMT family transporter [Xanthomonadales bacterium]|nr:DMT family transporter [Xanthomonadales bacterium]